MLILFNNCSGIKDYKMTNSIGIVKFQDLKTNEEIVIKILDSVNLQPLKSINVKYNSGEGFEVFTAFDINGKYFPEIQFNKHNSEHVIKMEKIGDKLYKVIKITDNDQIRIIQRWASMKGMCHVSERTYVRTIDSDEYSKIGKRAWGFSFFFIGKIKGPIVYLLKTVGAFTLTDNFMKRELDEISKSGKRYDEFESFDKNTGHRSFYLQSNPPQISKIHKQKSNDTVTFKLQTEDALFYHNELEDPTVFLGETNKPDLDIIYRIFTEDETPINDWTYTNGDCVRFRYSNKKGSFIEFIVEDEVGNNNIIKTYLFYNEAKLKYRANLQNTGEYKTFGVLENPKVKWRYQSCGAATHSPIIHNGILYFSSYIDDQAQFDNYPENYLYALDITSGKLRWKFRTNGPIWSTPTVYNDIVYFGTKDSWFYAVNINSGQEERKFKKNNYGIFSSPIVYNDVLYFDSAYLYSLDINTGNITLMIPTKPGVMQGGSTFAIFRNTIYYLGNYKLTAIDINTGKDNWSIPSASWVGDHCRSSPAIYDGIVYFGNLGGRFYAIDALSGAEKWIFEAGDGILKSASASKGMVFFGAGDKKFYALDCKTGDIIWNLNLTSYAGESCIANDLLYMGTSDGYLVAIDIFTGIEKWKLKINSYIRSSPAIADGVIYCCSENGLVFAIE